MGQDGRFEAAKSDEIDSVERRPSAEASDPVGRISAEERFKEIGDDASAKRSWLCVPLHLDCLQVLHSSARARKYVSL